MYLAHFIIVDINFRVNLNIQTQVSEKNTHTFIHSCLSSH